MSYVFYISRINIWFCFFWKLFCIFPAAPRHLKWCCDLHLLGISCIFYLWPISFQVVVVLTGSISCCATFLSMSCSTGTKTFLCFQQWLVLFSFQCFLFCFSFVIFCEKSFSPHSIFDDEVFTCNGFVGLCSQCFRLISSACSGKGLVTKSTAIWLNLQIVRAYSWVTTRSHTFRTMMVVLLLYGKSVFQLRKNFNCHSPTK